MISWWKNDFGNEEIAAVSDAINKKKLSQGEITDEFEKKIAKFLDAPYCVCVPNGTSALTLAYMACGLKAGDEIIVSDRVFVATANAATILGARVISVDVKDDMSIDENLLENKISKYTKIIVPAHLNGIASNIKAINKIANLASLDIVEDACQAFGSKLNNQYLGSFGRFGCYSFSVSKILSTAQGGALCAKNKDDYELLKRIRNQGVFDVRKERNYDIKAFNFKFNDMQAAIGLVQLNKINEKISKCKEIYKIYESILGGKIDYVKLNLDNEIPLRFLILHEKNKELKEYLNKNGVETSFENISLHLCRHLNISGNYQKSKKFNDELLILPSGPSQEISDIEFAAKKVLKWLKR